MSSSFPRRVSEPLKLFIQKKGGSLVNEAVEGSFFIIEEIVIMIGLLFKKKKGNTKPTSSRIMLQLYKKTKFLKPAIS